MGKIIFISMFSAMVALAPSLLSTTIVLASSDMLSGGISSGAEQSRGVDMPENLFGVGGIFTQVTNIMLFLIGVVSVIMLIFGGLRYIISGGNSSAVTAAKNTILYAIVGLVIAILSYAIVNFVIGTFATDYINNGGGGGSAPTNV